MFSGRRENLNGYRNRILRTFWLPGRRLLAGTAVYSTIFAFRIPLLGQKFGLRYLRAIKWFGVILGNNIVRFDGGVGHSLAGPRHFAEIAHSWQSYQVSVRVSRRTIQPYRGSSVTTSDQRQRGRGRRII